MVRTIRKSLVLRITLPVILLIIFLGVLLDRFVLSVVADITQTEIRHNLESVTRRIGNICNINFENLLMKGQADNPVALIIRQGLVLGQIEDFFIQEDLAGFIRDTATGELRLTRSLPSAPGKWMNQAAGVTGMVKLDMDAEGWFAYREIFPPWDWEIIVLKNERAYSALKTKVAKVHLDTLLILMLASVLLIFVIYQTVKKPIDTIIRPLEKGEKPSYRGTDTFEFLSDSISGMMDAIRQNEEKYRSIVEMTTGFVWEADLNGQYTFVSETVTDVLGYLPEELLGQPGYMTLADGEAGHMNPLLGETVRHSGFFRNLVSKHRHKQGQSVFLETKRVPVLAKDGALAGYRGINKDITRELRSEKEREELARRRRQIQKLEAIGTLAGGLAHDFNNLLSVILGNVSLSRAALKKDTHIDNFLASAEIASIHAGKLASQLITFSKGGAPIKTPGTVADIIRPARTVTDGVHHVIPIIDLAQDLYALEFDPAQMKQVVENITLNAVESMPEGGKFTITARNYEAGEADGVPVLPGKTYIIIRFQDQGRGIGEKDLDRIFDPYFTTKNMGNKKGAGLGLTTAYSIVARHDGHISVASTPGQGTTVTVHLPAG